MSEVNSLADLGALTTGGTPTATDAKPVRVAIIDKQGRSYETGRRKDATARVWVKPGTGKITVNGKDQTQYFARPTLRLVINQPFDVAARVGRRL